MNFGPIPSPANRPAARRGRRVLAGALQDMAYETLPAKGVEDLVLEHLPTTVAMSVTTRAAKGVGPTIDLAARLAAPGYDVAPQNAARPVRDSPHLWEVAKSLSASGVTCVLVIGGDARPRAGEFTNRSSFPERLQELGNPFSSVGIGGYPDGCGHIPLTSSNRRWCGRHRTPRRSSPTCAFRSTNLTTWAESLKNRGCTYLRVGIRGAMNRQKPPRVSAGLGLYPSRPKSAPNSRN